MLLDGCLLWPASSGHLGYHLATTRDPRRSFGPSALGRRLVFLRDGGDSYTYRSVHTHTNMIPINVYKYNNSVLSIVSNLYPYFLYLVNEI